MLRLHQESQEDFAKNRIRVFVRDDNGMRLDGAVDQDTEIADGHWHHLLINVDTPNSKIDVILDLKNQPFTYKNRKALHNFSDFQYDMVVGALNSRGDVDNCFNGEINEAMFYDTLLTINQCEAHYNITRPWILGR